MLSSGFLRLYESTGRGDAIGLGLGALPRDGRSSAHARSHWRCNHVDCLMHQSAVRTLHSRRRPAIPVRTSQGSQPIGAPLASSANSGDTKHGHHHITVNIGEITIHRVVEQEGPFFSPLEFFPSLTPEVLEENRGWMTDGGYLDRQSGQLVLCIQSYLVQTKHHNILIDSCVGNHKPAPDAPVLEHVEHRPVREGSRWHWSHCRSDRLCDVYPSACRPCRVEHQARQRPMGSYLPKGQICLRRPGAFLLD